MNLEVIGEQNSTYNTYSFFLGVEQGYSLLFFADFLFKPKPFVIAKDQYFINIVFLANDCRFQAFHIML